MAHLHTTETGAGQPVILLHGLFGRSQNLAVLARHLAARFRVLNLDLRNHGASPHLPGMGYEAMAADVRATLAAHHALPAMFVGHSMGGKVAMRCALERPDEVERLVVADIAPVAYAHHNAAIAAALRGLALLPGLTRRDADAALAHAVPDPSVRGFLLQNLAFEPVPAWKIGLDEIAAGIRDIEGWPALPEGASYDGDALFLTGGASDYVGPAGRAAIGALFTRARIVTLPGAGHWLHAEQPGVFAAEVAAFLG